MKKVFFLLAVLIALNGCASSSRTARRTVRTSQTVAQNTSTSDQSSRIASSQSETGSQAATGQSSITDQSGQGAAPADQGRTVIGERGAAGAGLPIQQDQASLELRKEELVVGKRDVSNGGVLLRTVVQTNTVNQPVALRREEYVIERVPADQVQDKEALARATADAFQNREIFIALRREEPVASKRALLTEQVRLAKRVETDRVNVTHPVRSEDVEIVKVAAPPPGNTGIIQESAVGSNVAAAPASAQDTLTLEREELIVGKREVENGGVRLRKVVHTQEASAPVELQREEYNIDRVPVNNQVVNNADFTPREIRANLMRQEPVAGVRDYVTEVIRVRKVVETDNQNITANLRQESLEIIKNPEGTAGATGGTAMGTAGSSAVSGASTMRESSPPATPAAPQSSEGDQGITERVHAMLTDRSWTQNPPPWQVDETYLRKGIDVRPPRNVPPSQLPPASDLGVPAVDVTTDSGVVTLRGTVGSEAEKRYIGERVASVPGVRSVNNELRIGKRNAPGARGTGAGTLNNGEF